jgi:hypothetical protein
MTDLKHADSMNFQSVLITFNWWNSVLLDIIHIAYHAKVCNYQCMNPCLSL